MLNINQKFIFLVYFFLSNVFFIVTNILRKLKLAHYVKYLFLNGMYKPKFPAINVSTFSNLFFKRALDVSLH